VSPLDELVIERDRLRAILRDTITLVQNKLNACFCDDVHGDTPLEKCEACERLQAVFDVLKRTAEVQGPDDDQVAGRQAVIAMAREYTAVWTAWREKLERGESTTLFDEIEHRRAAAHATLLHYVRELDREDG
jgi:hypothetical protein